MRSRHVHALRESRQTAGMAFAGPYAHAQDLFIIRPIFHAPRVDRSMPVCGAAGSLLRVGMSAATAPRVARCSSMTSSERYGACLRRLRQHEAFSARAMLVAHVFMMPSPIPAHAVPFEPCPLPVT